MGKEQRGGKRNVNRQALFSAAQHHGRRLENKKAKASRHRDRWVQGGRKEGTPGQQNSLLVR